MYARALFAVALTLVLPVSVFAAEAVPDKQLSKEVVGTWKMVSAKYGGSESEMPKQLVVIKHVTPTHMTWIRAVPDSGDVVAMACGKWKLDKDQYSEVPTMGMGAAFATIKGGTHTFTCKIVGDSWYHTGKLANGLTIEEVWQRERRSDSDARDEAPEERP